MSEVSRSAEGFVVEARVLAEGFGLDPAAVPGLMRAGELTSRCEAGRDEDEGRHRLTFFYRGRALRLTVDSGGAILKRAMFDVRPPPPAGG